MKKLLGVVLTVLAVLVLLTSCVNEPKASAVEIKEEPSYTLKNNYTQDEIEYSKSVFKYMIEELEIKSTDIIEDSNETTVSEESNIVYFDKRAQEIKIIYNGFDEIITITVQYDTKYDISFENDMTELKSLELVVLDNASGDTVVASFGTRYKTKIMLDNSDGRYLKEALEKLTAEDIFQIIIDSGVAENW